MHLKLSTHPIAFGQFGGEWARGGPETLKMSLEGMRDELNLVVAYAAPSGFEHRKGDPGETQPRDLAARSDLILGKICPLPECPNLGTDDVERA